MPNIFFPWPQFTLILILTCSYPASLHAIEQSVPNNLLLTEQAEKSPRGDTDTRSLDLFYAASGIWVAILSAAILAILIMAHRIASAQQIRPSGDHARHHRRL